MKNYSLVVALSLTLLLQACGGSSPNPGPNNHGGQAAKGTSVETMPVSKQNISKQIQTYGNVKAQDIVEVTPQVSNRVTKIYADLGDTVRQGQALAKIYSATFGDQVEQAKAQIEQSRSALQRDSLQYERQKTLYDRKLISKADFENARATYQNSKAQLQSSKANLTQNTENLNNSIIRSPVYGVVLTRNIATGDLASTGQVAYEIGNLTGYETRVYLPLDEWKQVKIGQKVTFKLTNGDESTAEGRVSRISPRLDPTTGLGEVVITFTKKSPSIYQGVLVQSIINVATDTNAVVIPRSALVENVQTLIEPESNTIQVQRTYSAFVVQHDTLAIKRDLKLGIEQGDMIEILQGLHPGDQIVITGQTGLEDSSKVRVARGNAFKNNPNIPIDDAQDRNPGKSRGTRDSSSANSNNN